MDNVRVLDNQSHPIDYLLDATIPRSIFNVTEVFSKIAEIISERGMDMCNISGYLAFCQIAWCIRWPL